MTHIFSAKGIFCLYREGMLLGANSKNLLKELARTGYIAHPILGTRRVTMLIWWDILPSSLSGVVWHGLCHAKNCCWA